MASENDRILESITKLIKLTQQNKIQWFAAALNNESRFINNFQNIIGAIYRTSYKNKYLRLYRRRLKALSPLGAGILLSPDYIISYTLEIIDETGTSLWLFPKAPSLSDLYTSVQFQVSGVNNLIDDLLSEE